MKEHSTPERDGFSMPPEWGPHAGCLVSWPCKEDTWCGYWGEAKKDMGVADLSMPEPVELKELQLPMVFAGVTIHVDVVAPTELG